MTFTLVDDAPKIAELDRTLSGVRRIALDCEAAGFHRYSDRLCLVQLTAGGDTWILDPLALDLSGFLRPLLQDPGIEVVMHGADFDLRLLDRDLDIQLRGLFDTQVAAAILGESALGLASLLESYLDVELSKKYQRADWARRPLPADMLEYAASDTRHLETLADLLARDLRAKGRMHWAEQECLELESIRWEEDDDDPVTRVKGAHRLEPREVTALREALAWRDEIARERDRAPFRVAGDRSLMAAVQEKPRSVDELASLKGMNTRLARDQGPVLLRRLERVEELAAEELRPYPPREANGRGRPPPEVEELTDRLRRERNARAEELGIDRGQLVSNAILEEVAWARPMTRDELVAVDGLKAWQVEAMGDRMLTVLNRNG